MYVQQMCLYCQCRAYLVRDSTTVPNSYVLTMFAKSVAKNFQILPVRCFSISVTLLTLRTYSLRWNTEAACSCTVLMMGLLLPVLISC